MHSDIEAKPLGPAVTRRERKQKNSPKAAGRAAHRHFHGIVNQLSIINLCCFRLRDSLKNKEGSSELDAIEAAVSEGAGLLEKLQHTVEATESGSATKSAPPSLHLATPGNKVYHLVPNRGRRR